MNKKKLKHAEDIFLMKYPNGFEHPDMIALGKKHKMDKMISMSQASFKKSKFTKPPQIRNDMVQVISRSSMVSMFEKPKFRDFVATLDEKALRQLTNGLKNFLHANREKGFNTMVDVMLTGKLAKWSLITVIPNYFYPDDEVFIKPTTAKGVIQTFELNGLEYKSTPTWDFYCSYRECILEMKALVDTSLKPNNAAFCGFLMMSLNAI